MDDSQTQRPNVVFVLTDDHGPWAMGCSGNDEIKTPNLDRLAAEGVRFENFFCTSPVCSPARASILTGLMPSQHGVQDFCFDTDDEYLSDHVAYTELLANEGYRCGLFGKWHLGTLDKPQKGFSDWMVCHYNEGRYWDPIIVENGVSKTVPGYLTEIITDGALKFLDSCAETGGPFYLSLHYTAPHHLWVGQHPQKFVDLYNDCEFHSCPQQPIHPWYLQISNPDSVLSNPKDNLKGYFAAVTAMDYHLGRVLDRLRTLGLKENTLICFMSDNGMNCGHHGIWGKGNGTFPQNMYDSSVRVPAIMSHPGRIQSGVVCEELLSQYDVMPTLLDYLNISYSPVGQLPGRTFTGLLDGTTQSIRDDVVVYDEYGPVRMIRTKELKYVHRYPYGPHELYDLVADPAEETNLAGDAHFASTVHELRKRLEDWFRTYVDPRYDGVYQPVTGTGQSRKITSSSKSGPAFSQEALKYNRAFPEGI